MERARPDFLRTQFRVRVCLASVEGKRAIGLNLLERISDIFVIKSADKGVRAMAPPPARDASFSPTSRPASPSERSPAASTGTRHSGSSLLPDRHLDAGAAPWLLALAGLLAVPGVAQAQANRPPAFESDRYNVSFDENPDAGERLFRSGSFATDPDGDTLMYRMAGPRCRFVRLGGFERRPEGETGRHLRLRDQDQLQHHHHGRRRPGRDRHRDPLTHPRRPGRSRRRRPTPPPSRPSPAAPTAWR